MNKYGVLIYKKDKIKTARFNINKQIIRIGSDKINDIRLKKPFYGSSCLTIHKSGSSNAYSYIFKVDEANESILINDKKIDPNTDISLKNGDSIKISDIEFVLQMKKKSIPSIKLIDAFAGPISSSSKRKSIRASTRRRSSVSNCFSIKDVVDQDNLIVNQPLNPLINFNDSKISDKNQCTSSSSMTITDDAFVTAKSIMNDETNNNTVTENLTLDSTVQNDTGFVTAFPSSFQVVDGDQSSQNEKEGSNTITLESDQDNDDKDSKNDTFEVDPDKSLIKLTPTPSKTVLSTPKSNLKQKSEMKSAPKSVCFKEFIEENRTEYDKRTGKFLSSQKISKKLFFADDIPQDEIGLSLGHFDDDNKIKLNSVESKTSDKISTTPLSWSRIPRLYPIKTYTPSPQKLINLKSPKISLKKTNTNTTVNVIKVTPISKIKKSENNFSKLTPISSEAEVSSVSSINNKTIDSKTNQLITSKNDLNNSNDPPKKDEICKLESTIVQDKDSTFFNIDEQKSLYSKIEISSYEPSINLDLETNKIKNQILESDVDQNPPNSLTMFLNDTEDAIQSLNESKSSDHNNETNFYSLVEQPKTPIIEADSGKKKIIKNSSKTPAADYDTNVDFGIKKLEQPKTPAADYESNVDFAIKKLDQPKTPAADYKSNVDFAIKKLEQPKTPAADYESNVDWAIKKLEQPKTPSADYKTNVDFAIKKLEQPKTPAADYESNVDWAIKKLEQPKTPAADYKTNVDWAIKKLEQPKTPSADYKTNVDWAIKKLEQPKTPAADYESNVDFGIKKLEQPKTPVADYESNVDWAIKKLEQPKTPVADYESNVDFGIKKLEQPKTPAADYESNVDWAIKKLKQPKTPVADYESNVDWAIKKLQQNETPLADYQTKIDFGLKKLTERQTLSEYDCNLSMVQELFDTSEKVEEFSTPIKKGRSKNRKKNLEFPLTKDIDSNRPLTRSAVKAKIAANTVEKSEKKLQSKEDTKENQKPPVRRRKKIKDEIESLLESDDDCEKPDLPDIKKLTENLASYADEDSGDDGQQIKSSSKARAKRLRGTKNVIRGKKKTTADIVSSINILEMQDDQLMDANDMKEEPIVKKNTRKRKAATVVNNDSDDKSMIEVKKPTTRGRGRKKQQPDQLEKESDDQLEKEKNEVIQNSKTIKSARSKIILPKKDYKMKLTENNEEEEEMSNFDDSNKQFDSDIDIVNTRSRCRRTKRT